MLVQFQLVDQTRNVLVSAMELPNVHVYRATSKVRTRFVAVLNQRVLANHSHVVSERRAMLHEAQFAIVQNRRRLEIHSGNVVRQKLLKNCVDRAHVDKMPIVTLLIVVSNASAVRDTLVIRTVVVMSHLVQYANQIHALQMVNASFKMMVNQFASVHLEWAEIQQQLDVTDTNVIRTVIAPNIKLAWDSDVEIHAPVHAVLALAAK